MFTCKICNMDYRLKKYARKPDVFDVLTHLKMAHVNIFNDYMVARKQIEEMENNLRAFRNDKRKEFEVVTGIDLYF